MKLAAEWLRKKGLASAAKKAGRAAIQGLISVHVENNIGAIVEVLLALFSSILTVKIG